MRPSNLLATHRVGCICGNPAYQQSYYTSVNTDPYEATEIKSGLGILSQISKVQDNKLLLLL